MSNFGLVYYIVQFNCNIVLMKTIVNSYRLKEVILVTILYSLVFYRLRFCFFVPFGDSIVSQYSENVNRFLKNCLFIYYNGMPISTVQIPFIERNP